LKRLLVEDAHFKQQADNVFHENQFLNFLVNTLDEEVDLTLAKNTELDVQDIYEVGNTLLQKDVLNVLPSR